MKKIRGTIGAAALMLMLAAVIWSSAGVSAGATGTCTFDPDVECTGEEHVWSDKVLIHEATCAEQYRIYEYTCEICGYSYQNTIEYSVQHDTTAEILDMGSCNRPQVFQITCSVCGEQWTEEYYTGVHDYAVIEQVERTCYEDGYIVWQCVDCGDTYTDYDSWPCLGHTWATGLVYYLEDGTPVYVCVYCGVESLTTDSFEITPVSSHVVETEAETEAETEDSSSDDGAVAISEGSVGSGAASSNSSSTASTSSTAAASSSSSAGTSSASAGSTVSAADTSAEESTEAEEAEEDAETEEGAEEETKAEEGTEEETETEKDTETEESEEDVETEEETENEEYAAASGSGTGTPAAAAGVGILALAGGTAAGIVKRKSIKALIGTAAGHFLHR